MDGADGQSSITISNCEVRKERKGDSLEVSMMSIDGVCSIEYDNRC